MKNNKPTKKEVARSVVSFFAALLLVLLVETVYMLCDIKEAFSCLTRGVMMWIIFEKIDRLIQ